ncbi:MAG: FxsA family protein [Deferribacteres bacterium]|nr:FxsA family protein [candidate division KSB1 bacterium]MCB9508555.1 FxsA family protein [Deferribacteres bacterium]
MFARLVLLFIGLPLIELAILVKLGEVLGFWPTIGLVVITGFWGAYLARLQGFWVLRKIQNEMAAGRIPTGDLVDGLLILIGGIVLLTPGLLTDLAGFALLVPYVRGQIKLWLVKKFTSIVQSGQGGIFVHEIRTQKDSMDHFS